MQNPQMDSVILDHCHLGAIRGEGQAAGALEGEGTAQPQGCQSPEGTVGSPGGLLEKGRRSRITRAMMRTENGKRQELKTGYPSYFSLQPLLSLLPIKQSAKLVLENSLWVKKSSENRTESDHFIRDIQKFPWNLK